MRRGYRRARRAARTRRTRAPRIAGRGERPPRATHHAHARGYGRSHRYAEDRAVRAVARTAGRAWPRQWRRRWRRQGEGTADWRSIGPPPPTALPEWASQRGGGGKERQRDRAIRMVFIGPVACAQLTGVLLDGPNGPQVHGGRKAVASDVCIAPGVPCEASVKQEDDIRERFGGGVLY